MGANTDIEVIVRFWKDRNNRKYQDLYLGKGAPGYKRLIEHARDRMDNYLSAHLPPRFSTALERGGITKIQDLKGKSFRDLVTIEGVGISTLHALEEAGFIEISIDAKKGE